MFYKFIFYFLIGVAINTIWIIDLEFILFFFVFTLLFSIGHYVLYIKDINTLKDIVYRTLYKTFYRTLTLSCLIGMSLIASYYLVNISFTNKVHYEFNNTVYNIEGKVLDVSLKDTVKVVSLEIKSLTDLANNQKISNFPKYINMSVSPLHNYRLYDKLSLVGEIQKANKLNLLNYYGQENNKSNFINQNNYEKLFLNTKYNVSSPRNITVLNTTQNLGNNLNYSETLKRFFYETSEATKNRINNFMSVPYLGIAKGITFGEQEDLSKEVKQNFIDSGLIHIMVLSGANVSFIILIIFLLLNYIPNLSVKIKVIFTLLFSTLFIFATGLTAPSIRAGVMANTVILSEYFSKSFNIKNAILLSLFVLTLVNPLALIYSPSLHLSYLAIFGLVFVPPKLSEPGLRRLKDYMISETSNKFINSIIFSEILIKVLSVFLGILFAVGPYLIGMSGKINLLGIVASMLLEPVIILVTVFTFLITLFSYLSIFTATFLGVMNSFLVSIILYTSEVLSKDFFISNVTANYTLIKIYYFCFILWIIIGTDQKNEN